MLGPLGLVVGAALVSASWLPAVRAMNSGRRTYADLSAAERRRLLPWWEGLPVSAAVLSSAAAGLALADHNWQPFAIATAVVLGVAAALTVRRLRVARELSR